MRADDISLLVSVGRPTLSPSGDAAVFAVSHPDIAADRQVGQLWRVDLPDGAPRRITQGVSDARPVYSPRGDVLAFVRADDDGHTQVFVVPAAGGEPVQATDAPAGVQGFAWSPDGSRIAYSARVPEPGRYGSVDGLAPDAESPRRIVGIRWHANGLGYTADRPAQLFVIDVPDAAGEPLYPEAPRVRGEGESAPAPRRIMHTATPLTDGRQSWSAPVWMPDGRSILAVPDEIEIDRRDMRNRLVRIAVDGVGEPDDVVTAEAHLSIGDVAVASDGVIHVLASDVGSGGVDFVAPGVALYRLDADGPTLLTDPETADLGEVGSHLTVTEDAVVVQRRTRGRVVLDRIDRRDGSVATALGGDVEVIGHAAAGDSLVAAVSGPESFGDLVLLEGDRVRRLTDFGAGLRGCGLVLPQEREIVARDGASVHGWVAVPAGPGPFPVILQIHGGPYAQYGVHAFDETQVLVDAGYAVVYCNPRGSAGYGRAHGRAIRQAMGTLDYTDIQDFLDGVLADEPLLDADRVGIMGGSYGGYMTAWTIAHDHRFAAAIVERGFLDPETFQGTSDIGSFFGDEYVGTTPEQIAAQSPMAVVDRVRTPTLVMHSERDFRCPLEQATRYYTALRREGVPAEMLIFPGEDHELTRAGRPRHRVERFDAVLEWWARHLPTG